MTFSSTQSTECILRLGQASHHRYVKAAVVFTVPSKTPECSSSAWQKLVAHLLLKQLPASEPLEVLAPPSLPSALHDLPPS